MRRFPPKYLRPLYVLLCAALTPTAPGCGEAPSPTPPEVTAPEAPRQGSTPAPPAIKATWRALPTVTVEGQPAQFRSVMLYAFEDQIELQLHTGEHSCSKVAMLTTEGDDVSVSLTIRDKDDGEGATQRTVTHLMSGVSAPLTEWTFDG